LSSTNDTQNASENSKQEATAKQKDANTQSSTPDSTVKSQTNGDGDYNAAKNGGTHSTGNYYSNGNLEMSVGRDILDGSTFKKYEHPERLVGTQLQYRNNGNMKVINFKQDYVVLIRKKLYYAANSVMNMKTNAHVQDGYYVRSYKLDNWINLRTNISISGTPGNCQISLKGGEKVLCWEEMSVTNYGVPVVTQDYNGMVSDEFPDNTAQIKDVANNVDMTSKVKDNSENIQNKEDTGNKNTQATTNAEKAKLAEKAVDEAKGKAYNVETPQNLDDNHTWTSELSEDGTFRTIYIKSKKPNEQGKYEEQTIELPVGTSKEPNGSNGDVTLNNLESGYKIAEKCDWEPMDEVWIYGKSNFERDASGDFKMNQIFFGYIDTVTKSHQAGKTAGCTIEISATDQLKLLDLSYMTTNPSMTPGASGATGLDLRYSNQDEKHFGTFEIFNPFAVTQLMGLNCDASTASEAQKAVLRSAWRYFTLTNVFAGKPVCEIIKTLCLDAGIPPWYLRDRLEPIKFPPFTYSFKQADSKSLFNGQMMKRLNECNAAARKLMLEFFADEKGNIVLKCPNYALGVNSKPANNMGLESSTLLINKIDVDKIEPYYAVTTGDTYATDNLNGLTSDQKARIKYLKANCNNVEQVKQYYRISSLEKLTNITGDTKKASSALSAIDKKLSTNEAKTELAFVNSTTSYNNTYGKALGTKSIVTYTVKPGDTFTTIAKANLGNEDGWADIYEQAKEQFANDPTVNIKDKDDCQAIYGKVLKIELNRRYGNNGYISKSAQSLSESLSKKYGNDTTTWMNQAQEEDKNNQEEMNKIMSGKSAQYTEKVRKQYSGTLSEMTDALIPEIPQEFITSFSLTDTDKNIYNMYEVNIEGDFGVFDKGGPLQKISRVFPDIASMIRFGCRPSPNVYTVPYMGNKENAHLLGFMLSAQSLARRNSGSLSMIEDSFIHVGDPIRFFAYDEHPDVPLQEQLGDAVVDNSVLNEMSMKKDKGLVSEKSLEVVEREHYGELNQEFESEQQNEKEIQKNKKATDEKNSHDNRKPEDLAKEADKVQGTGVKKDTNKDDGKVHITFEKGDALNLSTTSTSTKKTYEFAPASKVAMKTDAQSIYYVESVSRSISAQGSSTMTLSLSCGRMMGKPSVMDYMLLLYKTYFDPALGFCADITEINDLRYKYNGKTKTYQIQSSDSLMTIAYKEYALKGEYQDAYTAQQLNDATKTVENDESAEYPYSLKNLCNEEKCSQLKIDGLTHFEKEGVQSINLIDFIDLFKRIKDYSQDKFTNLTSIQYGRFVGSNPDDANDYTLMFNFIVFYFDGNPTEWSCVRTGFNGLVGSNGKPGEWLYQKKDDVHDMFKDTYHMLPNHTSISGAEVFDYWVEAQWLTNLKTQVSQPTIGDNRDFYITSWNKNIRDDIIQEAVAISKGSLDINNIEVKKATEGQRKIEELHHAIIALNVDKFGNTLNINLTQFDGTLMQHVGETIVIPNEIILDGESKKEIPAEKTETVSDSDITDEEKAKFGDDVKKFHMIRNGKYVTRYEGSKMIAQYTFADDGYNDKLCVEPKCQTNLGLLDAYEKEQTPRSKDGKTCYQSQLSKLVTMKDGNQCRVVVVQYCSDKQGQNINEDYSKCYFGINGVAKECELQDKSTGKGVTFGKVVSTVSTYGQGGNNNIDKLLKESTEFTIKGNNILTFTEDGSGKIDDNVETTSNNTKSTKKTKNKKSKKEKSDNNKSTKGKENTMQPLSQNNETANVNNKKEDYREESKKVLGEAVKDNPDLLSSQKVGTKAKTYKEFSAKHYKECYESQKKNSPNSPDRIIQYHAERACKVMYYSQKKR